MALSRERFRFWLIVSGAYLLLTGWAVIYSLTCKGMLCHAVVFLAGLPWTMFLLVVIDLDVLSPTGAVVLTMMCAVLNVACLRALLGGGKAVNREDESGQV